MTPIKPLDGGVHAGRSAKDLTPFQWCAASVTSAANVTIGLESDDVINVAETSQDFAGVIQYPGNQKGTPTHIINAGRAKLKCTGTGKAGDSIKVVEGGKGAKAAVNDLAVGHALEDWGNGQVVAFTIDKHVAQAGAPTVPTGTPIANNGAITDFGAVLTLTPPLSNAEATRVGFAGVKDQRYRLTYIDSQADTIFCRATDFGSFQIASEPIQKGQAWEFVLGDNNGGNLLFFENPSADTGPITFKLELVP